MIRKFLRLIFDRPSELESEFVITARRYTLPVNKQPVFGSFKLTALNSYEAARKFDTTYTRWTRLDVIKVL